MNVGSLYHLVILFEESKSKLTDSIIYISPSLPYPFHSRKFTETDSNKKSLKHIGNRVFGEIIIETYTQDMEKSNQLNEDKITFFSGNPIVETTEGIIHIYKNQTTVSDANRTSTMLCIFSVPSHMTVKELLIFIEPMRSAIVELKIVQNRTPNHYMALLKFRTTEDTDRFFEFFNNTPYNDLEPDICQLVYISHIEVTHPSNSVTFPIKDLLELPSCPVCLERLDEPVQGILTTILCNHTFHDECIARVEDTTCPVCRYVQSPEMLGDSQCADCEIRENLWICLICGRIGCGRYGRKHAQLHFEETGHTFALELGKTLVWDYAGDAYVHRLIANQEDGKLVQLGPSSETGNKKLDMLSVEFSAVLTSQLESQRAYFETQLECVTSQLNTRLQEAQSKAEEAITKARVAEEKLNEISKENAACMRKLHQATSFAQRLQKELEEERSLNKSLLHNEETWRTRAEQAEAEAKTAKEECRELLLNFELRDKLNELGTNEELSKEELESCEISLQPTERPKTRRRRKR